MNEKLESYAYVYARSQGTYGHIYLQVQDITDRFWLRFEVSSQCGGETEPINPNMYALRYGIQNNSNDFLNVADLGASLKYMCGLEKKLTAYQNEEGYADTFVSQLHRIIRACGAKKVYIEQYINGTKDIKDNPMYVVALDGKWISSTLKSLEGDLLSAHAPKKLRAA